MAKKEKKEKRPLFSKLIALFLFMALIYIYAHYIGTTGIRVREYNINSTDIPESFDGFSIVQFSDMEIGSTFNIEDLDKLVIEINKLNPDIVVFTGDILSENYVLTAEEQNKLSESLKNIDALLGKYAVRGDDDVGTLVYEEVMKASDFKDLTNDYELIYYKGLTPIVLYGLDSLTKGSPDYAKTFSYPNAATSEEYMATYRILLAHEPDMALDVSDYHIALMISGHSHNSEINIPYLKELYNIDGAKTYYDEKYNVDGMRLYVSSGLGTSALQMRLFSRPSISIFRLYKEN